MRHKYFSYDLGRSGKFLQGPEGGPRPDVSGGAEGAEIPDDTEKQLKELQKFREEVDKNIAELEDAMDRVVSNAGPMDFDRLKSVKSKFKDTQRKLESGEFNDGGGI